ncbi:hypothetical protein GN956_G22084 [Arapaima gigas]
MEMISCKIFMRLVVLALLVVLVSCCSFSSGRRDPHKYDLSDLTTLYHSKVYLAEKMERPSSSSSRRSSGSSGVIKHTGVRVTLADGSQWLIHKGPDFGISSQTVVVDAQHMSNRWKVKCYRDFEGMKTVADFVKTGGHNYNLLWDNCIIAANRMMRQ